MLVKNPLNMDTFYGHVSVRIKGVWLYLRIGVSHRSKVDAIRRDIKNTKLQESPAYQTFKRQVRNWVRKNKRDLLFFKDKFSGVTRNSKPLVHFIITVSSSSSSSLSSGPPQPGWMPCDTNSRPYLSCMSRAPWCLGPQRAGYSRFQLTGMIEGFFGAWNLWF